jgi:hypothetical protein
MPAQAVSRGRDKPGDPCLCFGFYLLSSGLTLRDAHISITLPSVMAGSAAGRLPAIYVFVSFVL